MTFYWDFFGPRASGTAKHYKTHLDEFLSKHAFSGCETGMDSTDANHFAVWCKPTDEHAETIKRALRPQRAR